MVRCDRCGRSIEPRERIQANGNQRVLCDNCIAYERDEAWVRFVQSADVYGRREPRDEVSCDR